VALVDDDEVEGLDRHGRVVADELFLLAVCWTSLSETSSADSSIGSPLRMEYMRWMVLMHTCECGSMLGEASRCTL
jgi:hypothetical protein